MCTQSWIRTPDGFELFFNRDEARTRAPEEPGRAFSIEGVQVLAPLDGESGGTWIAANEFGMCVTVLNAYLPGPGRDTYTTRGRLPFHLAARQDPAAAVSALEETDLGAYRPFHLALVAPDTNARLFTWDGHALTDADAETEMPLASSGADREIARARRKQHLRNMLQGGNLSPEVLARFHASHEDAPSPWSPCMHADHAETRSLCHVVVSTERISLTHTLGAPCRTSANAPEHLERRG